MNQIIYIKYKEENVKKALLGMKAREKKEITTIEKRRIYMTEGIGEDHTYESPKT